MQMVGTVLVKHYSTVVDREAAGVDLEVVVPALNEIVVFVALAKLDRLAGSPVHQIPDAEPAGCIHFPEVLMYAFVATGIENLAADAQGIATGRTALEQMYRCLKRNLAVAVVAAVAVGDAASFALRYRIVRSWKSNSGHRRCDGPGRCLG